MNDAESGTQPRKAPMGWPKLCMETQATEDVALETSHELHSPGSQTASSYTSGGGRQTRRVEGLLCRPYLGRREYGKATVEGSRPNGTRPEMGIGLAKRAGNAEGVKVPTVNRSRVDKHSPHTEEG